MNKRFLIFVVVMILALSSLACSFSGINVSFNTDNLKGSGNVVTETRDVSNVTAVSMGGIGTLTIKMGSEESLVIEAEDNLLSYITSDVRNGQLTLATKSGFSFNPTKQIRYTLTVTQPLDSLEVSGLGSINAPVMETNQVRLNVSGSGDIDLEGVIADRLNVSISGLGSVKIGEGKVERLDVEISGSGKYDGGDVESTEATVEIGGLGNATIWVTEQLDAAISGSGDIEYFGNPRIQQDISGLGKLRSRGEH